MRRPVSLASREVPRRRARFLRGGAGPCSPAASQRTIHAARGLSAELLLEQGVEGARVPLALEVLHRLADEEAEQVRLASFVLLHLTGSARAANTAPRLQPSRVGRLGEALAVDDLLRRLAGEDQLGKDLFGGRGR